MSGPNAVGRRLADRAGRLSGPALEWPLSQVLGGCPPALGLWSVFQGQAFHFSGRQLEIWRQKPALPEHSAGRSIEAPQASGPRRPALLLNF